MNPTSSSFLTINEINTLLEALDTWEKEPTTSGFDSAMISALIGAMAGPQKGDPDYDSFRRKEDDRNERERLKAETDQRLRRETSTLLRAKLLTERNHLVSELTTESHA
jgi:hypothetical protein